MNEPGLNCLSEQRRNLVRHKGYNGLDYLEVSDDQLELTVYFLDKVPATLRKENFRIEGGRRVREIKILDLKICLREEPTLDDCVILWVDRYGDFSTYTLCLVALDENGRPTDEILPGFDPRYSCVDFSFKANCPSDLDCRAVDVCPPEPFAAPEINYLAKDYASFRQLILDRLAVLMPDWQERHVPDLGITLVELLAYAGDYLSYYQDAVATEAYLDTARQRISVRRHARLVDYRMHEGCNARAWVSVLIDTDLEISPSDISFITRLSQLSPDSHPVLTWQALRDRDIRPDQYEVFEPLVEDPGQELRFLSAHNEIAFYTWGDRECCLPKGAVTATLKDAWAPIDPPRKDEQSKHTLAEQWQCPPGEEPPSEPTPRRRQLDIGVGDILLLEEVLGPETGNEADADPTHRHAVRLTAVKESVDPLNDTPVLEITWAEEDALPFPLCLSVIAPAPACTLLTDVSVARGNVVLVDHGRRVEDEDLGVVPATSTKVDCESEERPSDIRILAARYRPHLQERSLTFREPLPAGGSAASLLQQDPRGALPKVDLQSIPPCPGDVIPLFRADELAAPSRLVKALTKTGRSACPQLANLLSAQTTQLLRALTESDSAPPGLLTAVAHDLETLRQSWTAKRDLLASEGTDHHFVVEMDDERRANLRFGDGELGYRPAAGTSFSAAYRVGNGPSGNVGAETIRHAVSRETLSGVDLEPRNPLPASGGTAPEPIDEVKLFAPHAFRKQLERAVAADDYAELVMREFKDQVQRAAATLRWNGSWYEVLVAVDPKGQVEAEQPLMDEIKARLHRYRRIGHDLEVQPARYVPLSIEMSVCVLPTHLRGHVKAALLDRFSNRVLPDGSLGVFHPDSLTFGQGIYLSELVAAAQAVPGVESVIVDKLERLYEGDNGERENGILPLGPLEIARLDNDPSFPENGVFKLQMGGGR